MKYKRAVRSEVLPADIQTVWRVVTDHVNYKWRSDIVELQILNENEWIEYYSPNNFTTFTATNRTEFEVYTFKMKNKRFSGVWTGTFSAEQNGTRFTSEEKIYVSNPILRWFFPLKKLQLQYFKDLSEKLQSE